MGDDRLGTWVVKVDGGEIDAETYAAVSEIRVDQSLHVADSFTIRLEDAFFEILDAGYFSIGRTVEIAMGYDRPVTVVDGEITAIAMESGDWGPRPQLVITGLSRSHRLSHDVVVKTYLDTTVRSIVSEIANRHRLKEDIEDADDKVEYRTQSHSDHQYLTMLARRTGHNWWVSGDTLHYRRDARTGGVAKLEWGQDLYKFKARASVSEAMNSVEVRGWDPGLKQAVSFDTPTSSLSPETLGSTSKLAATAATAGSRKFGESRFNGSSVAVDRDEARKLAASMADRGGSSEMIAKGEALGDPQLKPGVQVDVSGLGKQLSGKYTVTSAQHVFQTGRPYVTRFESGGRDPASIADLLGAGSAPAQVWPTSDVVVGIVTSLDDPKKWGRVKVKLPTLGDDIETTWARLVAPGAGTERGLQLRPEVNDEVLVAFEHGDTRRPLVLGGLWNGKDAPPADDDVQNGKVIRRTWQSRAGHRIEIVDDPSANDQRIVLSLADDMTELCISQGKVVLTSASDIVISGDGGLEIDVKKAIKIRGDSIELDAAKNYKLNANQISTKSSMATKSEGQQMELKASAMKVTGSGMTEIKGGIVKIN